MMVLRPALTALGIILLEPLPAAPAEFFTLDGHGGPVKGIDVSPDGAAILTASFDYSLGYWNGSAGPVWLEGHKAAVNAALFLSGGRAVSAGDDFELRLWTLATGESTILGAHKGKVVSLAVSPDGRLVASASWDGTIGLWPLDGGAPRFLSGHEAGVNAVAFSADGSALYSGSADGTLRLWDVAGGAELRTVLRHGFGVNTIVIDPGEGWLAYGAVDGGTRIIALDTEEEIADLTADRRPILAMDISPDGSRLAVGDGEGFIMVVDTADWSIDRDFHAATRGPVWALQYSADGQGIHAAGIDDVVYSWPVGALDGQATIGAGPRDFLRDPATMGNGERQFMRKCSICHVLTGDGARRAGPSLENLFGRRVGSVEGYDYSPALEGLDFIWNDQTIDDLFELGPDHFVPGSKMPMQRIAAQADRDDLVAFLREATVPQENKK